MDTEGKMITCKAVVLHDVNSQFKVETINVLPPTAGHIRIKMVATALCHSDLGHVNGQFPAQKYPCVVGHEGAGIVESVGEDVKSVQKGDKVFTLFFPHCGECEFCVTKKSNICLDIKRKIKYVGAMRCEGLDGLTSFKSLDGKDIYHSFGSSSFSEYTVVPENSCVKVNPTANLKVGCVMACGFLTGYGSSSNVVNIRPGDTVAVWGLGGVGFACVVGCKEKGASKIIGIDINSDKEKYARKFGCTDFISLSTLEEGTTISQKLKQLTAIGVNYAFICVGSSKALEDAINSISPGGTAVMVGVTKLDDTANIVTNSLLAGKKIVGTIFGNYFIFEDIPKAVDRFVEGKLPIGDFITSTFKIDQINEAVELMKKGEGIRSVIEF
ncbi:NAD/NADP dependent alcohol dehydrogenase [Chamberlinius hualienensis]